MSKLAFAALIAGIVGSGIGALDAAYVIKLKNGNEYITTRYWRERDQVLFDTYGGIFGVDRGFVTKIEKTNQPIRFATAADQDPADKALADSTKQSKDSEAKTETETKTEKKREPDDPIVVEFDRLKEKSKEVDGMLTSEIRDLLREIKAFKDKISGDSKLFVKYAREFNDVHEVASVVESALQSRR